MSLCSNHAELPSFYSVTSIILHDVSVTAHRARVLENSEPMPYLHLRGQSWREDLCSRGNKKNLFEYPAKRCASVSTRSEPSVKDFRIQRGRSLHSTSHVTLLRTDASRFLLLLSLCIAVCLLLPG